MKYELLCSVNHENIVTLIIKNKANQYVYDEIDILDVFFKRMDIVQKNE